MLYIAENIKALRKSRDMTQEDVAEVLGVTAQSVSKWERGDTYPDITLLPSLANFYEVTVDTLIGMDRINDDKAKTGAYLKGQRLLREGDNTGAADVFTEALKLYPNDESIMLELAIVLAISGGAEELKRAENLCERIMQCRPAETILSTAHAVLCYIYLKNGKKEEAVEAAQSLPHEEVCRFTVLSEISKDPNTEKINTLLSCITFRENWEHDILMIDFGLDMIPMVEQGKLLEKIQEVRDKTGVNKAGRHKLPMVRVRDNTELSPCQVRVRYFSDYLLDKEFDGYNEAVVEIIKQLKKIAR